MNRTRMSRFMKTVMTGSYELYSMRRRKDISLPGSICHTRAHVLEADPSIGSSKSKSSLSNLLAWPANSSSLTNSLLVV